MADEKEVNGNPEEHSEKKHSWLEDMMEDVNSDFPLSGGGEPEEDVIFDFDGDEEDSADDSDGGAFPLSGGQRDDD